MGDQGSEGLFSPFLRRRRVEAVRSLLDDRVLDFGCGTGKLAELCDPSQYCGVDISDAALDLARRNHPHHRFAKELPEAEVFDTIVGLAVIEHVKQPASLLERFRKLVTAEGQLILTTPHPTFGLVHDFGAMLGLFSKEASDEHETLLDRELMLAIARTSGWNLVSAHRFLFGANQVFVLHPTSDP
ncbi:MAG TPA: class I SAM-dependent methyltransferase [Polyangia bacterium]|jgi:2-polyprenyl-3-methyl-5-hydroxy-6-metoxy-1,4-benzoquinol methylase|nr:class I SAM-dependent methyltransferase [Polyangia bacterium]